MQSSKVSETIEVEKSQLHILDIKAISKNDEVRKQFEDDYKDNLYSLILLTLTHKSFEEQEAKKLFNGILEHKEKLTNLLQRDPDICVAALDYLKNIKKVLHYPAIIEQSTADFLTNSTAKDGLTGLYVRDILDVFIDKEIQNSKRKNTDLSFAMFDIDDFKKVNDKYGHQKGDEVLAKIGETINKNTRKMDFAARYGGEELCIVMPNTDIQKAHEISNRVLEKIADLSFGDFSVTLSAGVSQMSKDIHEAKDLIDLADNALYKAKKNGKNQVVKDGK
jgi:diguanylate cyclase (GGDEF)-like protein